MKHIVNPDRPFTVGMVGWLSPWKGQDVFLRAFALAFPDGAARARVIGSAMFGEDAYATSLNELCDELGLTGRVDFRGFQADIPAELAELDVLVHASVIPEPFGQVVVEGMAAGLPVIASHAGGPAEIIEHGRTGFLTPPGDVRALAAQLQELRADPTLWPRISVAGERASHAYAPAEIGAQITALYRVVLDEPRFPLVWAQRASIAGWLRR